MKIIDYKTGYLEAVDAEGIVLATASRCLKSEGSHFSGWIIRNRSNLNLYSDPIPTKAEVISRIGEFA